MTSTYECRRSLHTEWVRAIASRKNTKSYFYPSLWKTRSKRSSLSLVCGITSNRRAVSKKRMTRWKLSSPSCFHDGRLAVPKFGLSLDGQESFDYLVDLHENGRKAPVTDPKELFADVVHLYRTDMAMFHERRASDPEFLRRSNEANAFRLL